MVNPYSLIAIIYNPNSTGSGQTLAEDFASKIRAVLPHQDIKLVATHHAGHGAQLAREIATQSDRPLIISSSGDGGYHDIINGIMAAGTNNSRAVAGLLPGGNANDHYHNLHTGNLVSAIENQDEQAIDLLKLETTVKGKHHTEYAHSYVGIGFTPTVGKVLTKTKLNRFNEILIVLKESINFRAVRIVVNGKPQKYTSLVFSNIATMSKMLKLSDKARTNDGQFEITGAAQSSKLHLVKRLLQALTVGLSGTTKVSRFEFQTVKPLLVQLDGEVISVDANATVTITLNHSALTCII